VDYTYDELGRVVRRSLNGVPAVVTYDALGRVSRLRNALGTFRLTYVGATGRIQSIAYPNGQESVLSYFGALGDQRLRRLRHQRPDGRVLSQFDYTYETTGEILTQGRYQSALKPARMTYTYQYDAASQLLAAVLEDRTGARVKTYAYDYDAAGNRTGEDVGASHRSASFNVVNQLVSLQRGTKTLDFTYDANGNLLSDGVRTFEWDARDRLTAIVAGKRRSEFSYDGFDRRVRIVEKRNGAVVSDVWLLWCGANICEQRVVGAGTSTPQKRFFRFGETDDALAYFYTRDHLGSVRQMTDTTGAVVASYDYDPYGRTVARIGAATAAFGYADYYVHTPSRLSLTLYRAYDPNLGRWLSRDPIAENGGLNLHSYVTNDPINGRDPLGLNDLTPGNKIQTIFEKWGFDPLTASGYSDAIQAAVGGLLVPGTPQEKGFSLIGTPTISLIVSNLKALGGLLSILTHLNSQIIANEEFAEDLRFRRDIIDLSTALGIRACPDSSRLSAYRRQADRMRGQDLAFDLKSAIRGQSPGVINAIPPSAFKSPVFQ
jgi:RHS repeat-associated protein